MKTNKIVNTLLIFFIFVMSIFAQSKWTSQMVSKSFLDIKFLDKNIGWAVSQYGIIVHTTNGGETWIEEESGLPDTVKLASVDIIDKNTAITVGEFGTILKTTDAGSTWNPISSGTSKELRSVHFIDSNIGFASGKDNTLLKTTNGGDSWTGTSITASNLEDIFFIDSNVGWLGGRDKAYKTTNGGDTWIDVISSIRDSVYLFSIHFYDQNIGWAGGQDENNNSDHGVLFRTTDGGSSWTNTLTLSGENRIRDIHFITPMIGWCVVDDGRMFKSTDGGINWIEEDISGTDGLSSIHFVNEYLGWAAGGTGLPDTSGIIFKYDNSEEFIPSNPPSNISAMVMGDSAIRVSWNDNSNNEDGFIIEREINEGSGFEIIDSVTNETEYIDNNVVTETQYCYRITAYNEAGQNTDSSFACETIEQLLPPQPATGLTAVADGDSVIHLSWTDNSDNEAGFIIQRRIGTSGSFTNIDSTLADTIQYNDKNVSANTEYCYRIVTYNSAGANSDWAIQCATTEENTSPPIAPTNVSAFANGDSSITITWDDNSNNETAFQIQRKFGGAGFEMYDTVNADIKEYVDTVVTANIEYCYQINAIWQSGVSISSEEACATPSAIVTIPNSPTDLSATAEGDSVIVINWTDNSDNEIGFIIQRKVGTTGSWNTIDSTGESVSTFRDNNILADTEYCYQVSAFNSSGPSTYSDETCATASSLISIPTAPTSLSATEDGDSVIVISWIDNSDNEDGFTIERRLSSGSTWSTIESVVESSYRDRTVSSAIAYCYRVYAYNNDGNSDLSNEDCATTETTLNYPSSITVSVNQGFGDVTNVNNYRMIGLPGNSNIQIRSIISGTHGTDWNAYYDNGNSQNYLVEYSSGSSAFTFTPGKGFWVISRNNFEVNQNVNTVPLDGNNMYSIPLPNATWNIISNPFENNVSWADVRSANSLSANAVIYNFNGSFSTSTTFEPNQAYYFMNPSSNLTELKIPYSSINNLSKENVDNEINNSVSIQLVHNNKFKSEVKLGLHEDAVMEYDNFDIYAPPGDFANFNLISVNKNIEDGYNYFMKDFRNSDSEGQKFDLELKSELNERISLKLVNDQNLEKYEIYLIDDLNNIYNIRESLAVKLNPKKEKTFLQVLIGKQSFIDQYIEELSVTRYSLNQNYPNPFNPTTSIKFSLPKEGNVKLVIYDILGNKVTELVDDFLGSGNYEYVFDASKLASGIYIYNISVSDFNVTKKMMLLK